MSARVRAARRTDVSAGRTKWSGKDRTARPLPVRPGCVAMACRCWASCVIVSPSTGYRNENRAQVRPTATISPATDEGVHTDGYAPRDHHRPRQGPGDRGGAPEQAGRLGPRRGGDGRAPGARVGRARQDGRGDRALEGRRAAAIIGELRRAEKLPFRRG